MSTPQDRIPAPSDVTKVIPPSQQSNRGFFGDVLAGIDNYFDFVKYVPLEIIRDLTDLLPEAFRVNIDENRVQTLEQTGVNRSLAEQIIYREQLKEQETRRKIEESIPYNAEMPAGSEERLVEVGRLFNLMESGEDVISPSVVSPLERLYQEYIPPEIRREITGTQEAPLNRALATVAKVVGIGDDPLGMIEGPTASVIPFGRQLYNRIDKAVEAFSQGKATGAQWLKQLTTGVPEPERRVIGEILGNNMREVYTKDEIKRLISDNYKAPVVEEVRFGGSGQKRELQQIPNEEGWKFGNDYTITERNNGRFILRRINQGTEDFISDFNSLEDAMNYADAVPELSSTTKWSQFTIPGGNNYEEIVLKTPEGGIFKTSHWGDVENPIVHLRMTTREASTLDALQPIKARQIDELQSDWAQKIRRVLNKFKIGKGAGIRPAGGINKMPDVELGELMTTTPDGSHLIEPQYNVNYEGANYNIIPHENGNATLQFGVPIIPGGSNDRLLMNVEAAKSWIKNWAYSSKTPDMPFSQTDQWVDLGLERAIQNAIDEGADFLTWTPSQLQYDLYGSNIIGWKPTEIVKLGDERAIGKIIDELNQNNRYTVPSDFAGSQKYVNMSREELTELAKGDFRSWETELAKRILGRSKNNINPTSFMINAKKQYGGEIPGVGGLEQLAEQINPTDVWWSREIVSSRDELEEVLKQVLESEEDAPRMADKLWNRMQTEPEGVSLPRKEGMEYFYDTMISKRIKAIGKKMGIKLEPEEITVSYPGHSKFSGGVKQMGIRITDELKNYVKEHGFPLLGIGAITGAGATQINKEKENNDPIDQLFY